MQHPNVQKDIPSRRLDVFERYLTIWVFVCMLLGLAFGKLASDAVRLIGECDFGRTSHLNIPIAVLIWLMIYPMMLKIDFGGLRGVFAKPKGLFVTLLVNWLVKPFSMALLGWIFISTLFGRLLDGYRRRPQGITWPASSSSPPLPARLWFSCGVI